jgi:drug/metabolite transporter (DMT)-like permease
MQASNSAPNPAGGLILLASLISWVFDIIYRKRGGQPTPKKIKREYMIAIAIVILLTAAIAYLTTPEEAGQLSVLFLLLVFADWEIQRHRIRRKYPVTQIPNSPPSAPPPLS